MRKSSIAAKKAGHCGADQSRLLASWLDRLGRIRPGEGADGLPPGGAVGRVDRQRPPLADLVEHRDVGGDHRRADGERLDQRQPVSFGERGQKHRLRPEEEAPDARRRQARGLDDVSLQAWAALEEIDDMLVLPAALADQHEFRRGRAQSRDNIAPDVQKKQVVLARLDRAAGDEIGMPGEPAVAVRPLEKDRIGGRRRDEDRHVASPEARKLAADRLAHDLRGDDDRTPPPRDGLEPAHVPGALGRQEIFRRLDRQDVMQEKDAVDVGPISRPLEIGLEIDRELADVEINAALGEKIAGAAAHGQPMAPDPGEGFGELPGSPLRNALGGPRRSVDRRDDLEEMRVGLRRRVLAPVLADVVERLARRPRLDDPRAERRRHHAGPVAGVGIDEMIGERKIDAIDPVRRAIENARDEARDVVDDGSAPHRAHAEAGWRAGAPLRSTPFSCKAVIKGLISPQFALSKWRLARSSATSSSGG